MLDATQDPKVDELTKMVEKLTVNVANLDRRMKGNDRRNDRPPGSYANPVSNRRPPGPFRICDNGNHWMTNCPLVKQARKSRGHRPTQAHTVEQLWDDSTRRSRSTLINLNEGGPLHGRLHTRR